MTGFLSEPASQKAIRSKCLRTSQSFVAFKEEETEQSIPVRFERTVCKYRDKAAVKTRSGTVSYEELNKTANRITRAILAHSALQGRSEQPIALFFGHGAAMIAAILAVLKTGRIYVPVDPAFPRSRSEYMLENSQAGLVLTNNESLSRARELAGNSLHVLNIDEIDSNLSHENPDLKISSDTYAYILYTSGSTGKPKGVVQTHRNVLHDVMEYTNTLYISSADRMTLLYSYSVNGAVRGIFGALLNGATLFPLDVNREGLAALTDLLIQNEITFYHSVPTVFRNFVAALSGNERFPALRVIRFGGERVLARDVELYKSHFPDHCVLYTGMGATETGHIADYFIDKQTSIPGSVVPTGYAVEGKEVLLLDGAGGEVGPQQVGEIAVKSNYLSPGYWRKPELTQSVFLSDPTGGSTRIYRTGDLGRLRPDGCIEHLGRKDFQAKVRGFRVEVAETEMALLAFSGIKEAVVVVREDQPSDQQLVGYLVAAGHPALSISALRSYLKDRLPDYMVPSAFVMMDALPLTPNGKINRLALPPPGQNRPESETQFVAPRNPLELQLKRIWERVLGVHHIGVSDNFLDLGGHSLLAVRLAGQIENALGKHLTPIVLFQSPTIRQLAELLSSGSWTTAWASLVPFQPSGTKQPFFWVHGDSSNIFLPRYLGPDQPLYGLEHQGLDGTLPRHTEVETIAAHYLKEIRTVEPAGPYFLGGYSFGGVVAFEIAQQLRNHGEEVALLFLLDSHFPGDALADFSGGPVNKTVFRDEVQRHLHKFARLNAREKLDYVALRISSKIKHRTDPARKVVRKALCSLYVTIGRDLPPTLRSPYILGIYNKARRSYEARPYSGRAIYVKSSKRSDDYQSNWARLIRGGLESIEVPGDHLDMIKEVSVRIWANQLRTALEQAQLLVNSTASVTPKSSSAHSAGH